MWVACAVIWPLVLLAVAVIVRMPTANLAWPRRDHAERAQLLEQIRQINERLVSVEIRLQMRGGQR